MEAAEASLCYFFKNWLMKLTQMPKPQEYTDTFILTKKLFLVGLRGLQNMSNPVERPCMKKETASTGSGFIDFTSHFSKVHKIQSVFFLSKKNYVQFVFPILRELI